MRKLTAIFLFLIPSIIYTQIHISGPLSGVLEDTTYIVDGNISVEVGDSLVIEAGAELLFDGWYSFEISGFLESLGTEEDSIKFIPNEGLNSWHGLDFTGAIGDTNILEYCIISCSVSSGIYIAEGHLSLKNCKISDNIYGTYYSGDNYGVGICVLSDLYAENCLIENNHFSGDTWIFGGGIACIYGGNAILRDCVIKDNILNNTDEWTWNDGAGLYTRSGESLVLSNCIFKGNDCTGVGSGGAFGVVIFDIEATIENCIFDDSDGIELKILNQVRLSNCTLINDNQIVYSSINNFVTYNTIFGSDISIFNSENNSITYSNFNEGITIQGNSVPENLGILSSINNNGDSCDIYFNTKLDPQFIDPLNGNFQLQAGSHCIDAGNPNPIFNDFDESVNDMGAFGGSHIVPSFIQHDFGETGIFPSLGTYVDLIIFNNRLTQLSLLSASFSTQHFSLEGINFPVIIPPMQSDTLRVVFAPFEIGTKTDSLVIFSNDLYGSDYFPIYVEGTGIENSTLFGSLSGIITAAQSPYLVVGDLVVEEGETLIIEPGVSIYFTGDYDFQVDGTITTIGTENDSIIIASAESGTTWAGIDLNDEDPNHSELAYCLIRDSNWCGIWIHSGSPVIRNCTFKENTGYHGGGIRADYSSPEISGCVFENNFATHDGGGLYLSSTNAIVSNCNFYGNEADNGGALCEGGGVVTVTSCYFHNNNSLQNGGAVFCGGSSIYIRCIFQYNECDIDGGGGFFNNNGIIENCVFYRNFAIENGCAFRACAGLTVINSIVYNNTWGNAVYFHSNQINRMDYNCLYANGNNTFAGNIPNSIGEITTTNLNGDSCDIYYNIYLDPQFQATSGDSAFRLTENSPCIDAGDPESPLDPDSTIADIGAYYFHHEVGVDPWDKTPPIPIEYALYRPFPNPFNPRTKITFSLPEAGEASLIIYDIQGREVARLIEGFLTPGIHQRTFDASHIPSGVYFARLQADGYTHTQKLLLLK